MNVPPKNPKKKPLGRWNLFAIIVFGLIMGSGTLFVFAEYKDFDLVKAQTMAFTALVMFQMFAVLSVRTSKHSFSAINPFSNLWILSAILLSVGLQLAIVYFPPLQLVFSTVGLSLSEWIKIVVVSSVGFIGMELSKFFIKWSDGVEIK